jgi:hypothetical protein
MKKMTLNNDYKVLADRIILFPGAIKQAKYLVELAKTSEWEPSKHEVYSDGVQRRFETELVISDDTNEGESALHNITDSLNLFFELINSTKRFDIGHKWPVYVSKYCVGGFASLHSDEGYTEDNGIYTAIMYLNGDYEGGEVAFTDYNVEVKPTAGDVLIFPSYYMHYSAPVESGDKYMGIFRV